MEGTNFSRDIRVKEQLRDIGLRSLVDVVLGLVGLYHLAVPRGTTRPKDQNAGGTIPVSSATETSHKRDQKASLEK